MQKVQDLYLTFLRDGCAKFQFAAGFFQVWVELQLRAHQQPTVTMTHFLAKNFRCFISDLAFAVKAKCYTLNVGTQAQKQNNLVWSRTYKISYLNKERRQPRKFS